MTLEEEIIRVLAYFDVFDYPLEVHQILSFISDSTATAPQVRNILGQLVDRNIVAQFQTYFSLSVYPSHSVALRLSHESRAKIMIRRARLVARLIRMVPYVRGIFLTGSLSKGVAPQDSDIDFMIITANHRLWISRFFLTIIKKTLFLNSKRHFCINLFMTEQQLVFQEQSFYNAVEISTVLPLWNSRLFKQFIHENSWVQAWFPQWTAKPDRTLFLPEQRTAVQYFLETVLEILPLDSFDTIFLGRARSHWRKKYAHLSFEQFERLVQCTADISSVWAADLKSSIMNSFTKRCEQFTYQLASLDD